jgi:hypothetical protein
LPKDFWTVFDHTLDAAGLDSYNDEKPNDRQWVNLAINRSMGHLASAFFSGLFALSLKAGDGIPAEHRVRLDTLVGRGDSAHRFARVIAASRLPYLFAIDPDWAANNLIPLLDWDSDSDEAAAAWQGFAWNPRVSKDLWPLIKNSFLLAFTQPRLDELGECATTMAQIVMLAGLEFDLAPAQAREAIRSMTDRMRGDALFWLWNDLLRAKNDPGDGRSADDQWRHKVETWLSRAWPKNPELITTAVSRKFALLPTSLETEFPNAVQSVLQFVVPGDADFVVDRLIEGKFGQKYPEATLKLLRAVIPHDPTFCAKAIREILNQIVQALPSAVNKTTYRSISDQIAAFENT